MYFDEPFEDPCPECGASLAYEIITMPDLQTLHLHCFNCDYDHEESTEFEMDDGEGEIDYYDGWEGD